MTNKRLGEEATPLCHIDDIPEGDSRGFQHLGQALLATKKDGVFYCYQNTCPHLGLPLEWQEHQFLTTDKSLIQCASHGALFSIENGYCLSGPCLGQSLEKIETHTQGEWVYVTIQLSFLM